MRLDAVSSGAEPHACVCSVTQWDAIGFYSQRGTVASLSEAAFPLPPPPDLLSLTKISLSPVFPPCRNAATANMCSVCYKHHTSTKQTSTESQPALSEPCEVGKPKADATLVPKENGTAGAATQQTDEFKSADASNTAASEIHGTGKSAPEQVDTNRCFACNKRVGFTGFKCRCNYTFCASHRHSNKHNCTFDYKAMGRESVAKANPAVIAEKMDKVRTCRHFQRGATRASQTFPRLMN